MTLSAVPDPIDPYVHPDQPDAVVRSIGVELADDVHLCDDCGRIVGSNLFDVAAHRCP